MSKVKFLIPFCFSLILVGCASSGNVEKSAFLKNFPDWVNGKSSAYPSSEYISATGDASDKKAAQIDAINELVSVFGQSVSAATASSRRMEMAQSKGIIASSDESALDHGILREINQNDIIAVEVPEFFESKKENKWYALAVMSKVKGSQIYSAMIEKNQGEIASIIREIKSEKDSSTMTNFSRLDFAEEVAKVNEGYLKRLTVLNPSSAAKFDSIYTPVQIHKMKIQMAEKIPVCVSVNDDPDGRIGKAFQEVMASYGFNTSLGSNERYVIKTDLYFKKGISNNGKTHFCEYVADSALNDTFVGETLIPLSISGREGSPTYENAENRVKEKISAKIKKDFAEAFKKYLGDFTPSK
ncbi:MAG: LPP20 family lipoprotein [Treponema sp.]|nr:LPP20 family lipoprotein [Treponema sp.]